MDVGSTFKNKKIHPTPPHPNSLSLLPPSPSPTPPCPLSSSPSSSLFGRHDLTPPPLTSTPTPLLPVSIINALVVGEARLGLSVLIGDWGGGHEAGTGGDRSCEGTVKLMWVVVKLISTFGSLEISLEARGLRVGRRRRRRHRAVCSVHHGADYNKRSSQLIKH